MEHITTPIIFFFIALSIRATLAFIETSITAMRLFKLKELANKNKKYEALFITLEKEPYRVIISTLVASSFADVTCAALSTYIMETVFTHLKLSSNLGFSLGIGIASIAIILFGEIIPKNYAKGRGERIFCSMLWLINLVYYGLYPLTSVLVLFSNKVVSLMSGGEEEETGSEWVSSELEIQFLINYIHEKGLMEYEKMAMLKNIFDLGSTPVREIMVPAPDIISTSIDTPISSVLSLFSKHQFTRLPVYKDEPTNIVGMVHQKDVFELLSRGEDKPLKDILRTILFIPESVKINQLLREFRQQHMHIAIVINEHGSLTGLITLEDILEEIVGEISDEHEPATEKITPLKQGGYLIDGSITLEALGEKLGITIEAEDAITLGGFLTEVLQHLPRPGEHVNYKGYFFKIRHASSKRVQQVYVCKTTLIPDIEKIITDE